MEKLTLKDLERDTYGQYYVGAIADVEGDGWVDEDIALEILEEFNEVNNLSTQMQSTSVTVQIIPNYPPELAVLFLN